MLKRLLLLLAAIVLSVPNTHTSSAVSSASVIVPDSEHFFINLESVRHIRCGDWFGTGEIYDKDRVLTANHVIEGAKECTDVQTGTVGQVIYQSPDLDIATIQFPVAHLPIRQIRYSCEGFKVGHLYYAIGWMEGRELVVNKLIGTSVIDNRSDFKTHTQFNHVAEVLGYIIPGMSGGPIVDDDGVMVGTNQASNKGGIGWSRPISDTYLCDKSLKVKAR